MNCPICKKVKFVTYCRRCGLCPECLEQARTNPEEEKL